MIERALIVLIYFEASALIGRDTDVV